MALASTPATSPSGASGGFSGAGDDGSSDLGPASSGLEFDARPGPADAGGESAAQPGVVPGQPAPGSDQAPQQELFTFGRRQWPNRERAENEFLNTIGRLQSAQRRLAEIEAERDTLRSVVNARGPAGGGETDGAPGEGAAAAVQEAAEKLLDPDSLDWELISGAMQERGPEVGLYLFAQKLAEALGKGFDARMKGFSETLSGFQSGTQAAVKAGELWDGAVMAADEQGQLFFPELSSPENLQTAMAIWREITDGMPPELAFSPRMARVAILEMRAMQQGGGAADDGTGSGPAGADAGPSPEEVAAQHVARARMGAESRGVLPPGRGTQPGARPRPETEEARIKRSLLTSGQEVGLLGFRR
jgi:hypothetical protein